MQKRKAYLKKAFALLICCVFLCCPVLAAESCSLRVNIYDELRQPIPHFDIELCQITTFNGTEHTLLADFDRLGITAAELAADFSPEQAEKAFQYIRANGVPSILKTTNAEGAADFTALQEGIYLVFDHGEQAVTFQPYLVKLPSETPSGLVWDVVSEPKAISPDTQTVTVYVEWIDNQNAAQKRPENVEVTLLQEARLRMARAGVPTRTVVLNESCNWQHTFHSLPNGEVYSVQGSAVPDYTLVEIEPVMEGYVLIYKYNATSDPTEKPDTPDTPSKPSSPSRPRPTPPEDEKKLPQTGFQLIPIYLMLAGGSVLVILGMVDLCAKKEEP